MRDVLSLSNRVGDVVLALVPQLHRYISGNSPSECVQHQGLCRRLNWAGRKVLLTEIFTDIVRSCSFTCWAVVPALHRPVEALGAGFRRQQRVLQDGHLPLQLTALCGGLLPLLLDSPLLGTHVGPEHTVGCQGADRGASLCHPLQDLIFKTLQPAPTADVAACVHQPALQQQALKQ